MTAYLNACSGFVRLTLGLNDDLILTFSLLIWELMWYINVLVSGKGDGCSALT